MAEGTDIPELYPTKEHIMLAVCDHFGFLKNDQGVVVSNGYFISRACHQKVAAKGSNMSNLSQHRLENHSSLQAQVKVKNYIS